MSLAYKLFYSEDVTVHVCNGFEINPSIGVRSFTVSREVADDEIALNHAITEFAVNEMKMNPEAIQIWECKEWGTEGMKDDQTKR